MESRERAQTQHEISDFIRSSRPLESDTAKKNLALSHTSFVTLAKLINLFEAQFSYLYNVNSIYLIGLS